MKTKSFFFSFLMIGFFVSNCTCVITNPFLQEKQNLKENNINFSAVKVNVFVVKKIKNLFSSEILEMQPEMIATGSGVIYENSYTYSKVITANHIIDEKNVLNYITKIKELLNKINVIEIHSFYSFINIVDYKGNVYKKIEIIKNDNNIDIAILKIEDLKIKASLISLKKPKIWEPIYIVGYPRGYYKKELFLRFDGYYSGKTDVFFEENKKDFDVYSNLYVVKGLSGSGIFNSNNEILGILLRNNSKISHIGYSITYDNLINFLKDKK